MGGIRILEGEYDGGHTQAVMVNDVIGRAFGPLFEDAETADEFQAWCEIFREVRDVRELSAHALDGYHAEWLTWHAGIDAAIDAELDEAERGEWELLDTRDRVIVLHETGRMREALHEFI